MEKNKVYYNALLNKDSNFEGVFFVGVKTTGVFCRPTCPARKPKYENCEFFTNPQDALIASYRPCKRCKPLSYGGDSSDMVKKLVNLIEKNPEKKWCNKDFVASEATAARRHFKKRFKMTFLQYTRVRRMGITFEQLRRGNLVIDSQIGYESGSGFRDAFYKIMGAPPSNTKNLTVLKASWIDTMLGAMIAVSNDENLLLLEFAQRRGLEKEIARLKKSAVIIPGNTKALESIKKELELYFLGKLKCFKTPYLLKGSQFQCEVWHSLLKIPYGQTRSYATQAANIGRENSYRAVANANGANQLAIIIPCHRVVNKNGKLGGYGGGIAKKIWLIEHEKKHDL